MNFGKFDETDLFHIEDSKIYKEIGSGIKTVEFILKYNEKSITCRAACWRYPFRYRSSDHSFRHGSLLPSV